MATKQSTVKEIVAKAAAKERAAYNFYLKAADIAELSAVKGLLNDLANFELEHERLLKNMDVEAEVSRNPKKIQDLRISAFLDEKELTKKANFQDILIYAIKREEKAHNFYLAMQEKVDDAKVVKLFGRLAEEELGHKNKLETIYDDVVYREN